MRRHKPGDLRSLLGLLGDLRQLPVTVLVRKEVSGFWGLESVKGPLCHGPLGFPLLSTVILLGSEGGLQFIVSEIRIFKDNSQSLLLHTQTEDGG